MRDTQEDIEEGSEEAQVGAERRSEHFAREAEEEGRQEGEDEGNESGEESVTTTEQKASDERLSSRRDRGPVPMRNEHHGHDPEATARAEDGVLPDLRYERHHPRRLHSERHLQADVLSVEEEGRILSRCLRDGRGDVCRPYRRRGDAESGGWLRQAGHLSGGDHRHVHGVQRQPHVHALTREQEREVQGAHRTQWSNRQTYDLGHRDEGGRRGKHTEHDQEQAGPGGDEMTCPTCGRTKYHWGGCADQNALLGYPYGKHPIPYPRRRA